LSDVCIGTSAAPTYLPAHSFKTQDSRGKTKSFNLIDGGVAANNPTLVGINHVMHEAIIRNPNRLDDWPLEKFLVLSLGTGHNVDRYKASDAAKWGLFEWLTKGGLSGLVCRVCKGGLSGLVCRVCKGGLSGLVCKGGNPAKWDRLGWLCNGGNPPIIDIFMQSSADMVDIHASVLFKAFNKHKYLRIQEPELSDDRISMDLSTEENLNGLKMIGTQLLDKPFSEVNIKTGHYEKATGENAMTNRDVLTRFAKELSAERMLRLTGALIKRTG
jgi:patatin-like phospholipase/acyl hydrolase